MNILFLIFSFNTGGVEKQLIEMSNSLSKKGHSVTLCIINDNYEKSLLDKFDNSVSVITMERPVKSANKLSYMLRLAHVSKEKNISIIHCQEPTGVVFASVARILNPKIKIIDTVHEMGEGKEYSRNVFKLADIFCHKYVAISEAVKSDIIGRGVPDKRIIVINNAIDTSRFRPVKESPSMNNKTGFNKNDAITIGNVARFFPSVKGQDILVKAIELLKEEYPNICCRFAGGIYREQEDIYKSTSEYISAHGLNRNICFCGNIDDVPKFLSDIDIFVLPSRHEGFGISLIEAMSIGIPCVASDIDGLREIITDSSLGVLAEPGNEQNLADKIDYVIENYNSFNKEKISQYISDNYDIGAMVDKHLALYSKCIG